MDAPPGLVPFDLTGGALPPPPDPAAEPEGFVVLVAEDVRLHFHDWGGPSSAPGVLLIPGLASTAWSWAPVAQRLRAARRVVVMDLPGHGLSDAPFDGYDPAGFAVGGVNDCGGYAALWGRKDGAWKELIGTQDAWLCSDLKKYGVPAHGVVRTCIGGSKPSEMKEVPYTG